MERHEIRNARIQLAISQAELASRLDVTQPTISNWEQGNTTPNALQEEELRRVLGIGACDSENEPEVGGSPYGTWMSRTRSARGLTPAELSSLARISLVQVYNIESGRTANPRESTRSRINAALGAAPSQETVDATVAAASVEGLGSLEDFDPYSDEQLPTQAGVYVLYDVSQRPVYVGEGQNIRTRIRAHGEKFWFKQPIVQTAAFIQIDEQDLRKKVEQILIQFLKSNAVLNKQHVRRDDD